MWLLLALGFPIAGLIAVAISHRSRGEPDELQVYSFAMRSSLWGAFLAAALLSAVLMSRMSSNPNSQWNGFLFVGAIVGIPLTGFYAFGVLMPIFYFGNLKSNHPKTGNLE